MKAMVYRHYGTPEQLKLEDIPAPVPNEDEVLVEVRSASINSWDWDLLSGQPKIYRLLFGLNKPKRQIIGCDIAGKVVSVGNMVKKYKVGDRVFGDLSGNHWGGFAEFARAKTSELSLIPEQMTYDEACAFPQAGLLALQGLKAKIDNGMDVLINGAGGGVGTFAIQLAQLYDCNITAIDHGDKLEQLKRLGATHVLDYTKTDFTKTSDKYDLILDPMGRHSARSVAKVLKKGGHYAMVGGKPSCLFNILSMGTLYSMTGSKKIAVVTHQPNTSDLDYLSDLYTKGQLKPIIDQVYPLEKLPEALQRIGDGKMIGKLVIRVK
ncbi:MAG TPA: alcohol dehydrogenase [Cytophagales bacterium]|jgi:NADPH:quinone reductase-like Zn-dependent oxidoreductase|nr:alcohol dehydrogenase [Cytophagales bacterium]